MQSCKCGILGFAGLVKFNRSARGGGFKLIIVGGVLPVEGVAAVVENDLGDGFLASKVGKLFKIVLHIFSGADQGVERWRSVGGDFAGRGLSKARRAHDTQDGERGNKRRSRRRSAPPVPPGRGPGTLAWA